MRPGWGNLREKPLHPQFDFMPPRNEDERLARVLAALPEGDEALIELARRHLRRYDREMLRGDAAAAEATERMIEDIAVAMHGGSHRGMAVDDGGEVRLHRAIATDDGSVPPWGIPGRFIVTAAGCRCLVTYPGLTGPSWGWEVNAVDFKRPFLSSTGFKSLGSRPKETRNGWGPSAKDKTVAEWCVSVIEDTTQLYDRRGRTKRAGLFKITETRLGRKTPGPPEKDPAWKPGGWIHEWLKANPLEALARAGLEAA